MLDAPSLQPPEFWSKLLAEFSRQLQLPLQVNRSGFSESGRLSEAKLGLQTAGRAEPRGDGLVVYHRQVWMRFFETLQQLFPRLAMGLGYFEFNRIAHQYLLANPSRNVDVSHVGNAFGSYFRAQHRTDRPLLECLNLDEAEQRARRAPYVPIWQPAQSELAVAFAPRVRIVYAPSFTLLQSQFRVDRSTQGLETGVAFVTLAAPEHYACLREVRRVVLRSVASEFAAFLELCSRLPLGEALATLEAGANSDKLAGLVQAWIAEAVRSGIWVGLSES